MLLTKSQILNKGDGCPYVLLGIVIESIGIYGVALARRE